MILLRFAVAVALAVLPPAGAMAESAMLILHPSDTTAQDVSISTRIEVRLPAILGAGYSWMMHPLSGDIVTFAGEESARRGPGDPNLDGAPDVQIFRFTAKRLGVANLTFDYRQPFDHTARPSKTYAVSVRVVAPR